jgi:hypothetical protein
MIYQDIEEEVRKILIADSILQSLLNVDTNTVQSRVRIGYINNIENPEYPCVTFNISLGNLRRNEFSVSARFHLHVWAKDSIESAQNIYGRVRELVNLQPITKVAQFIERNYEDNLYEEKTRTFHISSWYEVQAVNR